MSSCSVLGFAVHLPGREQPVYIDCLSLNLAHDSPTAVMVLKLVLRFVYTHKDLKGDAQRARKLVFWCDCGPHFRSKRFFFALFCELPDMDFLANLIEIILNFFLEKHGKSVVDGHFGMIVYWVKLWVAKKRLITRGDLKKAIEKGWRTTSKLNGESPPVYVLEYDETDELPVSRSKLDFFSKANMKRSYCFRWQSQFPDRVENFGVAGMVGKITPKVFDLPGEDEDMEGEEGSEEDDDDEGGDENEETGDPEEGGEEEDQSAQARFTKWARDVAPEAQTDFGQQRKTHQHLRGLCGDSLFEGNLDRIIRKIDEAQAQAKALGALSRVNLPTRKNKQMPAVKQLLKEPGRGLLIFAPDAQAWTVANVEYAAVTSKTRQDYVEVVLHHPTGAVSKGFGLSLLSHMVLPLANAEESCVILDVNFFTNGFEDYQVDVATWEFCEMCRRWRVIPAVVREHLRKRKGKFICREIHPEHGCQAPFSDYEKNWRHFVTDAPE